MEREVVYYPHEGPITLEFVKKVLSANPDKDLVIIQESTRGILWGNIQEKASPK